MRVTVAVTAKNEENTIRETLVTLEGAIECATAHLAISFELLVVLNDSTDRTKEFVPEHISILETSGGLVEAQRVVADRDPFVFFSDADILVDSRALVEVVQAMLSDESLMVAYPQKVPLKPEKRSFLARALYTYNLNDGFENKREHFNGKFFAIRGWEIPRKTEFSQFTKGGFLQLSEGVLADDIYLSKFILSEYGAKAIQETTGKIYYRIPATFEGMYRYFRRMKVELLRVKILFPDLKWPESAARKTEYQALANATFAEIFDWSVFRMAFCFCRLRYWIECKRFQWLGSSSEVFWKPVVESKRAFRPKVKRLRLPHRYPLEIWDLLVDGKTLWAWQKDEEFYEKLKTGLEMIRKGEGESESKGKILDVAHGYDSLHFTGGRSKGESIRSVFPEAVFSKEPIFGACEAALKQFPTALVVDVGQTQIKVAYRDERKTVPRDYKRLPIGTVEKDGELLSFVRSALPVCQPELVILALPCYVHDDLTLGGSSYAEMKQNQSILADLSLVYPLAEWLVLNDAELATLGLDCKASKSLVVTLGFGVGACIIHEE